MLATSDVKDVYIEVAVRVAKVGVYAADIAIITPDDSVIHEETLLYKRRRSSGGVERSALRVAREWCEMHGYNEIEREDDDY